MGTSSRLLPLRATRAGMISCNWVAGRRSASATRSVVLNGVGVDFDDAGSGELPPGSEFSPSQGQQHGVRGQRRVADEGGFFARVEEPQPHIVIRGARGEHEGYLGMREFAGNRKQRGIALSIGVEHHRCRIAREARGGKCVNLKNAQTRLRSPRREFCTPPAVRLHFYAFQCARQ